MVGLNQYHISPGNHSNGYISYSQTVGWRVNVMAKTMSMLLSPLSTLFQINEFCFIR